MRRGTTAASSGWRSLKAWQAAKEYDGKLSEKVKADAEDASRRNNDHVFVHACVRRERGTPGATDVRRSLYESIHFEQESGHICRQGGFFEYPLVVRRWDRDGLSPYGSPPQAKMMGDIKSLQSLVKDSLVASAQAVRPPLATHKNERPLDLNPGRVNPGLIDEQGRRLYGAMIDTVNPGAAFGEIDRIREALRLGLYGDLWQTLLDGNGRTATEATIRAQEKADMIGPFTTNIQAGHGVLFDREIGILGRRGAFEQGSPLAPPQSVAETEISVRSTAPIDQMREAGHFEGLASFRQYLNGALQTNPEAADWLDEDEERKLAQRSLGLPQKLLRRPEEVEEIRAQRAQQQAQQQQLAAGESLARMAKDGAPMAKLIAEQGGGSGAGLEEALAAAQAAGGGAPAGGDGRRQCGIASSGAPAGGRRSPGSWNGPIGPFFLCPDGETVLADLAADCGMYQAPPGDVTPEQRAYMDGRKALFARILACIRLPSEEHAALQEAARLETLPLNEDD